jgi:hypothetical protein
LGGGTAVRRQFTIELCVDYADKEKNALIQKACQRAARELNATAILIEDGMKTRVAIYSDDLADGRQPVALMDDTDLDLGVSEELLKEFRETK